MPTPIEFAPRARADLRALRSYLRREAGARAANAAEQRLRGRIRQLAIHPRLGPVREDFDGRRLLVCDAYAVIYFVEAAGVDERVVILRIVHAARDIPTLLEGE